MHILSKLLRPRLFFRPVYRQITFNTPIKLINECKQSKQILVKQQIRCNQIDSIYKRFQKADPRKLKLKDNVPEFYKLIYRNTMHNYFFGAQILSTIIGVVAFVMIPLLYGARNEENVVYIDAPAPRTDEGLIIGILLIGTCVAMQVLLRKCPMRIYNQPKSNNYIFVFYGSIPFSMRQLPRRVKDIVHVGKESAITPWSESNYSLRDYQNNIIMFENYFRRPADLYIMLGVQKNDELEEDED